MQEQKYVELTIIIIYQCNGQQRIVHEFRFASELAASVSIQGCQIWAYKLNAAGPTET